LAWSTTQDSLADFFSRVGVVKSVKIVMDRETGRSKGFAFIDMNSPEEASTAIAQLHATTLDGRLLRVNEAIPPENKPRSPVMGTQDYSPEYPAPFPTNSRYEDRHDDRRRRN